MKRNIQLDFFRGALLIIICINHLFSDTNIIRYFTYEFLGWVTAAEGFVFLSGITAGLVYYSKLLQNGEDYIRASAARRALKIYKYHVLLFMFTLGLILRSPGLKTFWESKSLIFDNPKLQAIEGLFLLYQPYFLDILPMYALFMLIVPFAITQFRRGNSRRVLAISGLIYLIATTSALDFLVDFQSIHLSLFNLLCWQLLFVLGLFTGYLGYKGKLSQLVKNKYLLYGSIVITGLFFILKNYDLSLETPMIYVGKLADKSHLRPLRLLNFFALTYLLYYSSSKRKEWFSNKLICWLGKYSLEVFSFHIVLVIIFRPILRGINSKYFYHVDEAFRFYPISTFIVLLILVPSLFIIPVCLEWKKVLDKIRQVILSNISQLH